MITEDNCSATLGFNQSSIEELYHTLPIDIDREDDIIEKEDLLYYGSVRRVLVRAF
jgi:hypothetical protein